MEIEKISKEKYEEDTELIFTALAMIMEKLKIKQDKIPHLK